MGMASVQYSAGSEKVTFKGFEGSSSAFGKLGLHKSFCEEWRTRTHFPSSIVEKKDSEMN
jgi:hypothetical protein